MIHAIVSDVHGNFEALETVLADIEGRGVTSIACLGDFVGYGASPNECIERLRPAIQVAVAGNHDLAACGRLRLGYFNSEAATAARWTDDRLSDASRAYLEGLPYTADWQGALLVHATPSCPEDWHYVLSPMDAEEELAAFEGPLCLIGHSHYPGAFEAGPRGVAYTREADVPLRDGCRYIVNVGSVGQPRDGDPRAAYLLYDDARRTVTHVRLEYDIVGAMRHIVDAGLPRFLAERLRWGE